MAKVQLGLIQTTGFIEPKRNVENHLKLIREAASKGAQIICLQEMFTTIYFCHEENEDYLKWAESFPGPVSEQMQAIAKAEKMAKEASA